MRYLDISIASNIAYFAILAFGIQKCLPLISNTFNLAGSFKFSTPVVDNFLSILDEEKVIKIQEEEISPLKFEKTINMFHDLNELIMIFYEKSTELKKKSDKSTKRRHIHTSSKKTIRNQYKD